MISVRGLTKTYGAVRAVDGTPYARLANPLRQVGPSSTPRPCTRGAASGMTTTSSRLTPAAWAAGALLAGGWRLVLGDADR
jgi:hypothetical protein